MRSIAFVTCVPGGLVRPDGFTEDDSLAAVLLTQAGHCVEAVRWDDPSVDWAGYDLVVVRSPWDYFHRLPEFLSWFDLLERVGARVHNPVPVLRANLHKRYLLELAEQGVAVTPSALVERGEAPSLAAMLETRVWQEAVVKPAVSGGAFQTWRVTRETAAESQGRFATLVAERDVLVQPYLADIVDDGEWSLVYFLGGFSHAARKYPAHGDFRVQSQHGGSLRAASATPELIATGAAILAHAAEPYLYARVDGVATQAGFLLMELEVLEPALFLATHPAAPGRFVDAILNTIPTAVVRDSKETP